MIRKMTIVAGLLAGLAALPAQAAGTAQGGLADLGKYNLIVFGNWSAAHDVEGRAAIVGSATGSSVTVGMGRNTAGQGATGGTGPTLLVGGNLSITNLNVNNGSNGGSGTVAAGSSVWVKGNASGNINLNSSNNRDLLIGGNSMVGSNNNNVVQIGGNMTSGNMNFQSGDTLKIGGTKNPNATVNLNGATMQQNLGAAFKSGLQGAVDGMTSSLFDNATALKTTLSGLTIPSNPSFLSSNGQTLILNAVKGGNDFSVFNLTQASLAGYTSIAYNFSPDAGPVVINFTGATVGQDVVATLGLNFVQLVNGQTPLTDDFKAVNQSVIWNFGNATKVNFTTEFFGSVLATGATVTNNNAINGSVVAGTFEQGGEVHLGTFDGMTFNVTAVPEPASWAMMILGFGVVGMAARRQKRAISFG